MATKKVTPAAKKATRKKAANPSARQRPSNAGSRERPTGAGHAGPKADATAGTAEPKANAPGGTPAAPFDPPAILGEEGAAKWRELAPLLQGLLDRQGQPLLDLVTRDLLASYCVAWESLVDANDELRAAKEHDPPMTYTVNKAGGLTPHPAFGIRKQAQAELRIAGKLLGLNPDARQKIKPKNAAAKKDDPVAAILGS